MDSDLLFQSNSKFIVNRIHFLKLMFKIKFDNEELKIDWTVMKSEIIKDTEPDYNQL